MDQRRFISFLMLSVAVLMLFSILFPPPPPDQPGPPVAGKQADGEPPAKKDAADIDDPDVQPAEVEPAPAEAQPGEPPQLAESKAPTRFVAIGSLDVASGYRMLATLTSTGAAVRRVELSSPRYRDQHDRSGYLGELELKNVPGGIQAQFVGAGTPAALAGIEAGDVIVGIAGKKTIELKTITELNEAMAGTKPGQQIPLQVRRGQDPAKERVVRLAWRPLAVLRPELENYSMRHADPPADFVDRPSFLLTLPQLNGKPLAEAHAKRIAKLLEQGNWEVMEQDASSVAFRRELPELKLEIVKRYRLPIAPQDKRDEASYPAYHLQLEVELRNTSDNPQSIAYQLDGPTGMPLEGWWFAHKISRERWFGGAGLRDIVVRFDGHWVHQIDGPEIAAGEVKPMGQGEALGYAGVDGQYFAAVMIPDGRALGDAWFDTVEAIVVGPKPEPRTPPTFTNVTCRLARNPVEVAPGKKHTDKFQVFVGPKRPALLAQYQAAGDPAYSLKDIVYYGLALFGAVARAMLGILHFFYSIVGNYGIAIIMLTVLVRGAMFPLSYKQTKNMARMQDLKPEMDRITEMHKTDMQKRSQAMQELYRKHQINPLGGCLPMFLQLPIFIGLYRALMVDVELRGSPLFWDSIRWCSNLAAPDMFLDWSPVMPDFINSGMGFFGLGPYLNILPLVTVGLFLVTQKMFMPEPTNEQAAMQQKMMKYMTIFMGLLFYKVASGLCLYFIASSLWGIAERKLLPKATTSDTAAAGGTAGPSAGPRDKRPPNGGPRADPNGRPGSKRPRKAKRKK